MLFFVLLIGLHFNQHYPYISIVKKQLILFVIVLFLTMGVAMISGALVNWDKLTPGKAAFLLLTGLTSCIISAFFRRRYRQHIDKAES